MRIRDTYDSVDDYLKAAPEFAKPICEKLRAIVRETLPKADEAIRYGEPCYLLNGMLCSFSTRQKNVRLNFFRGGELPPSMEKLLDKEAGKNLRSLRFTNPDDISENTIRRLLRSAAKLNDSVPPAAKPISTDQPLVMAGELEQELAKNSVAKNHFDSLPVLERRAYADWITNAKTPRTRQSRAKKAAIKLQTGKRLNEK